MSLATNVESIMGRKLTPEEIKNLSDLQQFHGIDDSDPLVVVLALMAKSQLLIESLPNLLQQKAEKTIELHQQTLREQSTLIAKELITSVAQNITSELMKNDVGWKKQWIPYAGFFVAGMIAAGVILRIFGH